jgi:hypothetical protein
MWIPDALFASALPLSKIQMLAAAHNYGESESDEAGGA